MQSAAEQVLPLVDRRHTPSRAVEAAHEPAAAGFAHVDLDLTYGTARGEMASAYRCSASPTQAANCSSVHPDSSTSSR